MATDCIIFGDGLYHIWRRTVSYLATKALFENALKRRRGKGYSRRQKNPKIFKIFKILKAMQAPFSKAAPAAISTGL